ncbi:hypothetical protein CONPUDRAFT_51664 [Coniophora puteana RWD-64-598 SS2]|uniref:Uncharacterized protein n=1 Tax=Coniophora puteana (strain RWD-64-598) TaxID=741705 RepID=A0A5M3MVJ2_CONPW|nr:uncharacterized protein CONPUDRAFT_51664 [Coniophora puteana RWD-64-598 SS2]EIW83153.1 hypothetical protein CONPUDRAFT_51664 [Coniophora puteana RWD-64-598 SS2]
MAHNFDKVVKEEQEYLSKVHPTTDDIPSCLNLFDEFLLCNVLGTQVKSLYRFGRMAECKQKMEDFKFCMSNKGLHPEQRRETWLQHRAEWWAQRRLERSSEFVWDKRTEPLSNWPPPLSESNNVPDDGGAIP